MPMGPGKYDELATHVRERAKAQGAIVVVYMGSRGSGFSVQAPPTVVARLPELLRHMADEIEASYARGSI